jgi:hypothetical protein
MCFGVAAILLTLQGLGVCSYGIPESLYKPPTKFEVIFDLVYDTESILNVPYYSKEVQMKSYTITVYMVCI